MFTNLLLASDTPPPPTDALEGNEPQRRPQRRLDRRLEEVAKAVGGGYCRLQMPLTLTLAVSETVAGHRLGALEGGGRGLPPPLPVHPPFWGGVGYRAHYAMAARGWFAGPGDVGGLGGVGLGCPGPPIIPPPLGGRSAREGSVSGVALGVPSRLR